MWFSGFVFYHDSAAALIHDGELIAAAQEERLPEETPDSQFPSCAIQYCLESAGVKPNQVDHAVFYEKPFVKFERLLESYLAFAPRRAAVFSDGSPVWIREKLFQKDSLCRELEKLGPGGD